MTDFEKWDNEFRVQNLYAFNNNEKGLLYLKVRAVCRRKQLEQFLTNNSLKLKSTKLEDQFPELYALLEDKSDSMQILDAFLRDRNNEWYKKKNVKEDKLISDLRKIDTYEWGGDQNNSLDQYLVRRYVKVISDYDELTSKSDAIALNAWKFVQTSWYNHWTTYLIESFFKNHKRVLSAVGEIKSVDFFIDNLPIDLKVTFFPAKYMESQLLSKLGNKELTWIKNKAKVYGVSPDKGLTDGEQMKFLKEELCNKGHSDVVDELNHKRKEVVSEAREHPEKLMQWMYEHQGSRLFGAENRLFLVMVDSEDMTKSWQMKRAFSLIKPIIKQYLDDFCQNTLKKIEFTFKGNKYTSLSDIIFIVR